VAAGEHDLGTPPASAIRWCADAEPSRSLRTLNSKAAARLSELVATSGTVREMLAFLCRHDDLHLTVQARRDLKRTLGTGGRSRFFVADATLVGRLEFDAGDLPIPHQRLTLAHEIAHGVELAALPRVGTRALATLLLARMGHHTAWWSHHAIETPFALDIEAQVARELRMNESGDAGRLQDIARFHRLDLPGMGTGELPGAAVSAGGLR
jgi:hypothetical protein